MLLEKIIVYSILLLDILGIGILIPALPELVNVYHVPQYAISIGLTIYAMCAFFAAPVLGQMSDKRGRKPLLLICVLGSAFSYLVLLFTQDYWLFLAARAVNGLTGGNISILFAIMADISKTPEERQKNFGMMGGLFGLGFIIGPLLGSFLVQSSLESVFAFGFAFSVIESLAVWFVLKETHEFDKFKKIDYSPFPIFKKFFGRPNISSWLRSNLFLGIGLFAYQAVLSLYLDKEFIFPGYYTGYLMAGMGLITAVNQAVLLNRFWLKIFKIPQLILFLNIVLPFFFLWLGLAGNLIVVISLVMVLTLFQGLTGPLYQIQIISHTDNSEKGEITGLLGSVGSLQMFLGPLFGGFALYYNFSPFVWGILFGLISLLIVLNGRKTMKA